MKIIISILLLSGSLFAKEYTFNYKFNDTILVIKENSDSWEDAFTKASQLCYNTFKKDRKFSEEYSLDVIDVCVNPKN